MFLLDLVSDKMSLHRQINENRIFDFRFVLKVEALIKHWLNLRPRLNTLIQ